MLLCLFISHKVGQKLHWAPAIAFLIPAIYAIYQIGWPYIAFDQLGLFGATGWGSAVSGALMTLLLFTVTGLLINRGVLKECLKSLFWIALAESLLIIFRGVFFGHEKAYWMFMHPSLESCFIALMIPRALEIERIQFRVAAINVMISAVLVTQTSTGFALHWIMGAGYMASKAKRKLKIIPVVFGLSILAFIGGRLLMGGELLNPNGRFDLWKLAWVFYKDHNLLFGSGPGTFYLYGPPLQILKNCPELMKKGVDVGIAMKSCSIQGMDTFTWMHNDWLQVLFEGGLAGLLSVIILWIVMLGRSFSRPALFSIIFGFGFEALTQFPLRSFWFQLLGTLLVCETFLYDESSQHSAEPFYSPTPILE